MKCKIIDVNTYKTVYDGQCPISRNAKLTWVGFSDEGMLITMDDFGIVSGFNYKNQQWIPLIDLKDQFTDNYKYIWIVGFMENYMMYIELLKDQVQPHESMRSKYKKIGFKIPFVQKEEDIIKEKKEEDLNTFEEMHFREKIILDHEQSRREMWEPFKLFRGRNDNSRFLSESIMDAKEITQKKKDHDKTILNAIRLSIMNEEHDKVFTYLDMLHFTQSIKICIKLCNSLN